MKGVIIPTDGTPRPIDIQKDSDGSTLHSLQKLVGGNIGQRGSDRERLFHQGQRSRQRL